MEAVAEACVKHRQMAGRYAFKAACEASIVKWQEEEANLHGLDLDKPREDIVDLNVLKEHMEGIYSKAVRKARDSARKEEEEAEKNKKRKQAEKKEQYV